MIQKIAVLPGDGIGPEIIAEAIKVLEFLNTDMALGLEFKQDLKRTADIYSAGMQKISTSGMGDTVVNALKAGTK